MTEDTKIGKVKFYNEDKGFGFIAREGERDMFFGSSDISNGEHIVDGIEVEFEIDTNRKGEKAINVRTI